MSLVILHQENFLKKTGRYYFQEDFWNETRMDTASWVKNWKSQTTPSTLSTHKKKFANKVRNQKINKFSKILCFILIKMLTKSI